MGIPAILTGENCIVTVPLYALSRETLRNNPKSDSHIIDPDAPSAARVVYNYFGGAEKFPTISPEMMDAVDKSDSAQRLFTRAIVL
jgi:hypothetical protein